MAGDGHGALLALRGVAEVPGEAVHAGGGIEACGGAAAETTASATAGAGGGSSAGVTADDLARCVEDVELERRGGRGLEIVTDHGAGGGIGGTLATAAAKAAPAAAADGGGGHEEMGPAGGDLRGELAQGAEVVENPIGAALGGENEIAVS